MERSQRRYSILWEFKLNLVAAGEKLAQQAFHLRRDEMSLNLPDTHSPTTLTSQESPCQMGPIV
jgi:hypothetical protein